MKNFQLHDKRSSSESASRIKKPLQRNYKDLQMKLQKYLSLEINDKRSCSLVCSLKIIINKNIFKLKLHDFKITFLFPITCERQDCLVLVEIFIIPNTEIILSYIS